MTDRMQLSDAGGPLEYLSHEWFELVDNVVGACSRASSGVASGNLIVDYVSGSDIVHHQEFAHGELIAWRPGASEHANIRVERPPRVDAGDLLGRVSPHEAAARSHILVSGLSMDAVGTTGVLRRNLQIGVRELGVHAAVRCPDGPFGRLQVELGVDRDNVAIECGTGDQPRVAETDVYLAGPFVEFLPWLHGGSLLGRLIHRGWSFHGDLIALSALDGVISAPAVDEVPAHVIAVLTSYAAARNHPATLAKLDAIEEGTARTRDAPAT